MTLLTRNTFATEPTRKATAIYRIWYGNTRVISMIWLLVWGSLFKPYNAPFESEQQQHAKNKQLEAPVSGQNMFVYKNSHFLWKIYLVNMSVYCCNLQHKRGGRDWGKEGKKDGTSSKQDFLKNQMPAELSDMVSAWLLLPPEYAADSVTG